MDISYNSDSLPIFIGSFAKQAANPRVYYYGHHSNMRTSNIRILYFLKGIGTPGASLQKPISVPLMSESLVQMDRQRAFSASSETIIKGDMAKNVSECEIQGNLGKPWFPGLQTSVHSPKFLGFAYLSLLSSGRPWGISRNVFVVVPK